MVTFKTTILDLARFYISGHLLLLLLIMTYRFISGFSQKVKFSGKLNILSTEFLAKPLKLSIN